MNQDKWRLITGAIWGILAVIGTMIAYCFDNYILLLFVIVIGFYGNSLNGNCLKGSRKKLPEGMIEAMIQARLEAQKRIEAEEKENNDDE